MAENEVKIRVTADDRDASSKIQSLGGHMGGILRAGALAGGAAIVGLGAGLYDAVQKANEQIRVETQLNAVLESTHNAAGLTADQVKEMARGLQQVTTYGDEATLAGQNILLTFTNIGGEIFPQVTETMLDMSTALGQDMQSSAIQLGKALNDPIRGVTALQRVGVSFTDSQKDQIKTMVEAGDVMGAQKLILHELGTEFGGSARAQAETFSGRMEQLKNTFGDVEESIGMAFLPLLQEMTEGLNSFLTDHQQDIENFAQALGEDLAGAVQTLGDFFHENEDTIRSVLDTFVSGLTAFQEAFTAAWDYISQNKGAMIAAITAIGVAVLVALGPTSLAIAAIAGVILAVGYLRDNWDEIKAKTEDVMNAIGSVIDEKMGHVDEIIIGTITHIVDFIREHWDEIYAIFHDQLELIRLIVQNAMDTIHDIFRIFFDVMHGDWGAAWDDLKNLVSDRLEFIRDIIINRLQFIHDVFVFVWSAIKGIVTGVFDDLVEAGGDFGTDLANAITDAFKAAWNAIAGVINDVIPDDFSIDTHIPGVGSIGFDLPDNPLRTFHQGGLVPGSAGQNVLAVLEGGERVLSRSEAAAGGASSNTFHVYVQNGGVNEMVAALDWVGRTMGRGAALEGA